MNIYEIAKKAGVSTATVSRVLNNRDRVSDKTREKILKLIEEEKYIPSSFARGLSGQTSKSIGVLTIDIRDQYFSSVILSLEQRLSQENYNVILCNTGGGSQTQRDYLYLLQSKKVEVIVLVGSVFEYDFLQENIKEISSTIPIVTINEKIEGKNIYSIVSKEKEGIESLVEYLHNLGHKNLLYIQSTNSFSSHRKLSGFKKIAKGQPTLKVESSIDEIPRLADLVLKSKTLPSAIVCDEDLIALWLSHELSRRGYIIPDDFSITGFNNLQYSTCANPMLTTVDNQSTIMGNRVGDLILDLLNDKKVEHHGAVESKMILRASTGSPKDHNLKV